MSVKTYWIVEGTGGYYGNEHTRHPSLISAMVEAEEHAETLDVDEQVYVEKVTVERIPMMMGTRPLPTAEDEARWARERAEKIARGEDPDALVLPSFSVQRGGIRYGDLS